MIKPVLDLSAIPDPIVLRGRIDAVVNYLTGAGGGGGGGGGNQGQGGGGGGDEDPMQRSALAQDIETIANVLENAAVSGNLDPSLGPTPRVDVPTPNLDIDNEPVPDAAHPPGFGDALSDANQFRQGGPGAGGRAGLSGALRVTFPTETLSAIAQEATLAKGFVDANDHLAVIRTFITNEAGWATETTLAGIAGTLDQVKLATERVADAPLVNRLVDAGVAFPNDPQDPTNAAFTQSPIQDILSQGGLSLFAGFDNIDKNLQTLLDAQSQQQGTPDLSVIPGTDPSNPMYIIDVNRDTPRKVEVVNDVRTKTEITNKTLNTNVVNTVGVKHVGSLAVTQGGEFVVQLSGGGTLPVYVQGGRLSVDIEGGLEGLALQLADEEVRLNAVGAL